MTPEQEVAKVFYDQNMANFLTLKPCFAETEGCYLSSKDEKIVAAAASINESCTDSLREDKTTFNQHRAQAPLNKFREPSLRDEGPWQEMGASEICNWASDLRGHQRAGIINVFKKKIELSRASAERTFGKMRDLLNKHPDASLSPAFSRWLHPERLVVDALSAELNSNYGIFPGLTVDDAFFDNYRSDMKTWTSEIYSRYANPRPKMDRGSLGYSHAIRVVKKTVAEEQPHYRLKRVACSNWRIDKTRQGNINYRLSVCNFVAQVQGETGCREFETQYKESYSGGGRYQKSDSVRYLKDDSSRLVQCK
jgi:hypothetical protein